MSRHSRIETKELHAAFGSTDPTQLSDVLQPHAQYTYLRGREQNINWGPKHISLEGYQPLMDEAEVALATRVPFGELTAVIELPRKYTAMPSEVPGSKDLDVFCFRNQETRLSGEKVDCYTLLNSTQISTIMTASRAGASYTTLGEMTRSMGETLQSGQSLAIGRKSWLPGLGNHVELAEGVTAYAAVSGSQAAVFVDHAGILHVSEGDSYNGTVVHHGKVSSAALREDTGEFPVWDAANYPQGLDVQADVPRHQA